MHPRISFDGLSSFNWTFEQDLALARRIGAHSITIPFGKVERDVAEAGRMLAGSGLKPVLIAGGGAGGLIGGIESMRGAIDAARALGAPGVYTVSGPAPAGMSTDQAFAALVAALQPVAAYAAQVGVRVGIEHNSVASRGIGFVHSFADAADLAKEVDIDIVLEMQNIWKERRLPELFRQNLSRIFIAQVSDFTFGEEMRMNRRVPGDGDLPLEWLIGELLDSGYAGLFDIEILGPHIEAEGYEPAILRAVEWLSECLARFGV